jgi:hypothetical protein
MSSAWQGLWPAPSLLVKFLLLELLQVGQMPALLSALLLVLWLLELSNCSHQ